MGGTKSIGDVGERAVVQQGEHLTLLNLSVELQELRDVGAAQQLIDGIRAAVGGRPAFGSPLRRLEPLVLVNRKKDLLSLVEALESPASVVVVEGVAGVGKSSLARAALELRDSQVPVLWLAAEATSVRDLVLALDAAAELGMERDGDVLTLANAVLSAMRHPVLVVLDGAEALLDDATGDFVAREYARLFELLTSSEHAATFVVTTRQRPAELAGVRSVRTVRLLGLAAEPAGELLRERADDDAGAAQAIELGLLKTLGGNPKLITLLAASLDELPLSVVAADLRETTDIGAYVTREVLSHLTPAEHELVITASLMPAVFALDDLLELHGVRCGAASTAAALKALLRRDLLEKTDRGDYFIHALVAENAEPDPEASAAAHVLAASWLEGKATPEDLAPLVRAAGHLQQALDRAWTAETSERAVAFLDAHDSDLSYGGSGRLLIGLVDSILDHEVPLDVEFLLRFRRGNALWQFDEYADALPDFEWVWDALHELAPEAETPESHGLRTVIGAKIADVRLGLGDIEGAQQIADGMGGVDDPEAQVALRIAELHFGIARKRGDGAEMLTWARVAFELAHAWDDEDGGTRQTRDAVAEAHFALGIGYLWTGSNAAAIVRNLSAQLRIKLDIGKLGGVASGLLNFGLLVADSDADLGTVMLGTAADLRTTIGIAEPDSDDGAQRLEDLRALIADPARTDAALERLGGIDQRLVDRARSTLAAVAGEDADATGRSAT